MDVSESRTKKILVVTAVAAFLLLVITVVIQRGQNHILKEELRTEKLKQDSILSTKILLDKKIADLVKDIDSIKGMNVGVKSLPVLPAQAKNR